MHPRQWTFCVVGALTVMTVIGCYSHYPSSLYGPGGYPGLYTTPPGGSIQQGPAIISPGTTAPGSSGSSYDSSTSNRWQPGGDAPAYNPSTDGVPSTGNDNPVPDYNDPTGSTFTPFDSGDFQDTNNFGEESSTNNEPPSGSAAIGPFDSGDGSASIGNSGDRFVAPAVPVQPVSSVSRTKPNPNPYKYDRENYRWLRGVVDYEPDAGTWNIIYNLEPDGRDRFGGSIVLLGADRFGRLQENDVVLVEGSVDLEQRDAFGKPQYRVDRLERLVPIE